MNIIPYNNRLLIEEVAKKEQKIGDLFVPEFVAERRDIPKFLKVRIIKESVDIENNLSIPSLKDKLAIVETGFLEEIVVDGKKYMFCPYNYIVCIVEE